MSPIKYTEKGVGMHEALANAGLDLESINNVFMTKSDPVAVQAFIDAYDPLPDVKAEWIALFKADCLTRCQAIYAAITDADQLDYLTDLWNSVRPAGKLLAPNLEKVIAIQAAMLLAIAAVDAALTTSQVKAVAVNWPP